MTLKQIAEVMGKSNVYVKNLFVGINDISQNDTLKSLVGSAGATIMDIKETKGIQDEKTRLELLKKRSNGEITRSEMRNRAKALKKEASRDTISNTEAALEGKPVIAAHSAGPEPAVKISVSDDGLVIRLVFKDRVSAQSIEGKIRQFLAQEKGNKSDYLATGLENSPQSKK
jgi:hypothetical protein